MGRKSWIKDLLSNLIIDYSEIVDALIYVSLVARK